MLTCPSARLKDLKSGLSGFGPIASPTRAVSVTRSPASTNEIEMSLYSSWCFGLICVCHLSSEPTEALIHVLNTSTYVFYFFHCAHIFLCQVTDVDTLKRINRFVGSDLYLRVPDGPSNLCEWRSADRRSSHCTLQA